jgi:hypothetical protein
MRGSVTFYFCVCLIFIIAAASSVFADNAGSTAAFTRGGFVGARYTAFGHAGEAVADDVYSVYWNPAGLSQLSSRNTKSPEEIRERVERGDISGITEEDVVSYTDSNKRFSMQLGISAARIDIERNALFAGVAMSMFDGVLGIGNYSILSRGIDEYNESGNKTGSGNYTGSVFFVSYAIPFGPASVGVSLKGLYEGLSDTQFIGGGFDVGVQSELLPFIKVGCVAQDIGTGLYPAKGENLKKKYRFASPTLRASAAIASRNSDFSVGVGVVRHIEQDNFELNIGGRYDPTDSISLSAGFSGKDLSAGGGGKFKYFEAWYVFSFDHVGMGYNHNVSITVIY